jgi:hypothetical protein
VKALEFLLQGNDISKTSTTRPWWHNNLHPSPDVYITAGDFGGADEYMSAVTASAIHPDGVLAGVGSGGVEADFTTLVAIRCVGGPCGLVPSALEALGDLANGEGKESKREKSGLAEHRGEMDVVGVS